MSPKLDTLGQLTQSLQSLIADLNSPDQAYSVMEQSLKEISESIRAGKLTLHIVGQNIAQAQKLQEMLEVDSELKVNYQFRAAAIPPIPTLILNCNIICLIVPSQPLSESFKHLLKIARTSEISKFFIVIERSKNISPDEFAINVNQVDGSVKHQLQGVPYGIFSLLFNDHIADGVKTSIPLQPELEQFYNSLKNLSVLGTEAILTKWATNKVSEIIDEIEDILLKARNITDKKLPNRNSLIQDSFHSDSRKNLEKTYRKVANESNDFFRQIKIEVNQSKSNFLDEFKQNSIGQKIQEFTKLLQPQLITKGEYRNVYLQTGQETTYNSVHKALVDLCHAEIAKWATGEWERIKNEYAGGGMSFFFEDSFDKLSLIPEVSIPKKDFSSSQKLNTQTVLNTSSVEPDIHFKYRKVGFFEYLLKNGKSHVFGSVTLTLIVTFLFKSVEQPGANAVKSDIEVKIFYLILFLVPFTISVLWFNYKQDRDIRLKEATDKLKKDSNAYYRSYTEWLVEKLIQRIDIIMSAEERRFQETLENVQEIYESYFTTQSQAESQQDHGIEQTKTIEYLNRLHHLKKLIQS